MSLGRVVRRLGVGDQILSPLGIAEYDRLACRSVYRATRLSQKEGQKTSEVWRNPGEEVDYVMTICDL